MCVTFTLTRSVAEHCDENREFERWLVHQRNEATVPALPDDRKAARRKQKDVGFEVRGALSVVRWRRFNGTHR